MSNRFFANYPSYIVTSPFGMRKHPKGGGQKMHNGIDLVATADGKTGQVDKIKAHTGGTVEGVGYDRSAGNYIKIRVSLDTVMVYYHLRDRPSFAAGDLVQTGQIIGTMGKTGNVTGAHLHFGIKKDGKWIDPAPYLEADYPVEPVKKDIMFTLKLPILKRGMKDGSVWSLQAILLGFGYNMGNTGAKKDGVDGSFGPKTEETLKKYQHENDLDPNGSCGPATWASLLGLD